MRRSAAGTHDRVHRRGSLRCGTGDPHPQSRLLDYSCSPDTELARKLTACACAADCLADQKGVPLEKVETWCDTCTAYAGLMTLKSCGMVTPS